MAEVTIRTNHVPREFIHYSDLTKKEQGYFDWEGCEDATYVRYKGHAYHMGEFMRLEYLEEGSPMKGWDGYASDSYFSGVLCRFVGDDVVMGMYFS